MRRLTVFAILALALAATARADEAVPEELKGIGIEERPGASVPLDAPLVDPQGRPVTLARYVEGGKPVVLILAYYRCPMLCSLVINGMAQGLKELAWTAGDQFRFVVVSFDPRDSVQVAHDKREHYLADYGRRVGERGFDFLTGEEASVRRIADAVGFHYRWDAQTQQYGHAAGAFVLTPQGTLSRTLYGIVFPAKDLRLALLEASQGKLGGAWDQVLLFCFHYDPNARGYVLAATRVMEAAGALTVLLLGGFLLALWRHDRRSGPRTRGPLEERPSAERFGSGPRTRGPLEERPSADRFGSTSPAEGEGGERSVDPRSP